MPTLRETIQADIANLEADLAAKKSKLADIETGFVGILDRDVEEVRTLFRSIAAHIFSHAPIVPPPGGQAQAQIARAPL
jgi:hypothetical protein